MVLWPKICMGCGKSDDGDLIKDIYNWNRETDRNHTLGYQEWISLTIHAYLCKNCEKKARIRRFIIIILSFIGVMLGFPLTFGAFGEIILEGLIILAPSIFLFIWFILHTHPASMYAKYYYNSGKLKASFKNPIYHSKFYQINPQGIEIRKN